MSLCDMTLGAEIIDFLHYSIVKYCNHDKMLLESSFGLQMNKQCSSYLSCLSFRFKVCIAVTNYQPLLEKPLATS